MIHKYYNDKTYEIYSYNIASQKVFEKAGFKKYKEKDTGYSYKIKLQKNVE